MSQFFPDLPVAPPDAILGINVAFNEDTHPNKVNLGIGAYRTDSGKPYVLNVVRKAEKQLVDSENLNKEYLPIEGHAQFIQTVQKLLFGTDSAALKENRIVTTQSLSGTGALRIGAEFLGKFLPNSLVLLPNPTWANHNAVFGERGLKLQNYRYFNPANNGLDFNGMIEDLQSAPNKSIVLLHACAHNPTGVDPNLEQWKKIAQVCKEKQHLPFFDCAYQGYASGDLDRDAHSFRYFVDEGFELFLAQSFAKNLGLYGERIGSFSIVCPNNHLVTAVLSQLKIIIRPMYSNPPIHGARIVATILSDPKLYQEWVSELKEMSQRIQSMRKILFDTINAQNTPGDWSHIVNQIGMFTYTGLTSAQVDILISRFHIHMLKNGRISMAGLNSSNVKYVAEAIHAAVVEHPKM